MKKFTKQLIVGITVGACLMSGGIGAYAASADTENPKAQKQQARPNFKQMPQVSKEELAAKIAKDFNVKDSEVLKALNNNTDMRDIGHAAMLAKISGKSFSNILAMKSDWRDVEKKLGITREDIRKEQLRTTALRVAENGNIDSASAEKLLNDGYSPMDIEVAARIANAAGKDIDTVLAARKINNQWRDVAKDFGVDEQTIRQGRHHRGEKPGSDFNRNKGEHRADKNHDAHVDDDRDDDHDAQQ